MTFASSVRSALRQYATFTGRATRAEFWWFYLFTALVGLVVDNLDSLLGTSVYSEGAASATGLVVNLVLLLPLLAVTVRRLHDSDLSGWWVLLPFGATFLATAAAIAALVIGFGSLFTGAPDAGVTVGVVVLGVFAVFLFGVGMVGLLVLMLRRSTPGPNRFGPHPVAAAPSADQLSHQTTEPMAFPGYGAAGGGAPGHPDHDPAGDETHDGSGDRA